MVESISGKVKENSACNFLKKNFTAVISQDFSNFQDVCLQDVSKKMSVQRSSFQVTEYFLQTFEKRTPQ